MSGHQRKRILVGKNEGGIMKKIKYDEWAVHPESLYVYPCSFVGIRIGSISA